MKPRHTLQGLTCALLAICLATACGSTGTSAPSSASAAATGSKLATIKVGYQPDADAPLYLAVEKHMFARYGLRADLIKFESGPPMFAAIKSTSIDVAAEGSGPIVVGPPQGVPQIGFMVAHDDSGVSGLVVRKGSGITSIAGLKGKTIAAAKDSGTYFALVESLAKVGLSLSSVQFKNLQPEAMMAAFQNGDIDAAWVWAPWLQKLAQMNGTILTTNAKQGIYQPVVWAANTAWAKSDPATLQRFIQVMNVAAAYAAAHPNQAAAALEPEMQVGAGIAKLVEANDAYPTVAQQLAPNSPISFTQGYAKCDGGFAVAAANIGKQLIQLGQIKALPPCSELYTPKYMQAYQASAGATP